MRIVIADSASRAVGEASNFTLDASHGDDNNEFELSVPGVSLANRHQWWVDGTPFGGVVDKLNPSVMPSGSSISYSGRTYQGVLASHIISPPAGSAHLVVSGDARDVIVKILAMTELGGVFAPPSINTGIKIANYSFHRYIDAYTGLRMCFASVGARLSLVCHDGGHELSAVEADAYGDVESERVYFSAVRDYRPVNRLIGLGKGEGVERAVSEWFADTAGNVSQSQTLFGMDEVAKTYQLTSEEAPALSAKTKAKLIEYQGQGEMNLSLPAGAALDVGDTVTSSAAEFGISTTTTVTDVVLTVSGGKEKIEYKYGSTEWPDEEE